MNALLLAATPLAPLLLLAALVVPALRGRALALLWLAPLPGLACAAFGTGEPFMVYARVRLTLALDQPSAMLLGGAALLWCAASVYVRAYIEREAHWRFAAWWLPTMAGSLGVFVAGDLVSFYFVFALASLPAWGLVIHDRTQRAWAAGATYILMTVAGEAALLAGFALLAAFTPDGSLAIADVLSAAAEAPLRDLAIAFVVIGFGLKAGLVPLHVWLPLAHPAAPMPASAVLSGAIIKAGVIGLIRFLPLDVTPAAWGEVLAVIGFVTAFWGVLAGITQQNPKTVLAYSSVSQMGVVAAAIGMGLAAGIGTTPQSAAFYALHHVLAKGALFLAVGVAAATGGRVRWLVIAPAVLLALGFGGLPPAGGWLAKEAVKAELGNGLAATLSALSAAGSTLLMLHFTRRLAAGLAADATARPPPGMLLPWLALAAASVLVPWALFAPAAGGDWASVLTLDALAKAVTPVLAGALAVLALARWEHRLPPVPEGDIIHLARRLLRVASPLGNALARGEALLRRWPVAGLAMLVLTAALGFVMMGR
ncbi:NADH/ubiquinone/plastoquinone (complex I) [Roseomonas terrae]|uniref:NADH/ubiquinone/plastoquinone (Complex I) n=1 Tax=Neoroseomonas terrae TaxID=424799 RepID=A0ABS5EGV5_9PROT|nr:NADH/ubiquinone/plastoquinone (complex I) [Neoroseomonas terrae]